MNRQDARRIARTLAVAALLLAGVVLGSLVLPWALGDRATAAWDPASAALRPPGTRLYRVELRDGRTLAAARLESLGGDRWSLDRAGRSETVDASSAPVAHRFLLGSDRFGRDILALTAAGGRVSLTIALVAGLIASAVGASVGAVSGLGPPWLDAVVGRTLEGLLAFPPLLGALLLAMLVPSSMISVMLVLAMATWMNTARLVRGEVQTLRSQDWARAAVGLGISPLRLFVRHLLPNLAGVLLIDATARVAQLILAESALSFLGFGVQATTPSWGGLLAESRGELGMAWWTVVTPGVAIVLTAFALSLLADGLRDRIDPRSESAPPRATC
jgi:peptide/nickel transport system permease protein